MCVGVWVCVCVCVGSGRMVVMVVYVGGSVGVLKRFVWRSLGVGMDVFGVLGWVREFLTRGTVYMLMLTISMSLVFLTQFGEKMD